MIELFKIRELGVCKKFQIDEKTAFTYSELKFGEEFRTRDLPLNFILFVVDGKLEISCNQYENRLLQQGQMILLLRASAVDVKVLKKSTVYMMYFDKFLSSCDQQLFKAYHPDTEKIKYNFLPTAMPQPIISFLEHIHELQAKKVDCLQFNGLKHREFFILLRHFCPREDVVMLLAPLIGNSLHFRTKVLEKFPQLKDGRVTELAGLVGMGRKNFDKQFNKEFGMSPAKWMLQEKAKHLYLFLTEPEVTIADAIDRFNFNSASHFNRFCLQYFNKTPGMIIREGRYLKK